MNKKRGVIIVKNSTSGITLISLVVTIIVLIILAGISINLILGDNGIITKALGAKEENNNANKKEQLSMAYAAALVEKVEDSTSTVTSEDINKQLILQKIDAVAEGEGQIVVSFDNGEEYIIESNGNVLETVSDEIFEFDATTGYITGIKEEYFEYAQVQSSVEVASLNEGISVAHIQFEVDFRLINTKYLIIPEEINGKEVIGIGNSAFEGIVDVEYVKIPNTIKEIGNCAFYECPNLKAVQLSNTLEKIGIRAFELCEKLETIKIPSTVTSIGDYTFYDCSNLRTINIQKETDSISGAPWSAPNATVNWNY